MQSTHPWRDLKPDVGRIKRNSPILVDGSVRKGDAVCPILDADEGLGLTFVAFEKNTMQDMRYRLRSICPILLTWLRNRLHAVN